MPSPTTLGKGAIAVLIVLVIVSMIQENSSTVKNLIKGT